MVAMKDSVTKLRQAQAELYEDAEKLTQASLDESLSPEDAEALEKEADEKLEAAGSLDAKIERAERIAKVLNSNAKQSGSRELPLDQQKPKSRVTIPATAKRYLPIRNFQPREIEGMSPDERAYGFGRFFLALAATHYPHLSSYRQSHIDSFGPMLAATEGGNAGIWVPEQFGTDLIILMERFGLARQLLNVLPMTSDKRTDPKEGSDPVPVFVGEGVEGTDVTPTDDSTVTLTARKLMAILINSSELNEDAIAELGDSLLRRTANGFAKKEDQCAWIGDGTATYGGMKGFNTRLADYDDAGTDSIGLTVGAAGTGAAWSGFTLDNFETVIGLLPDFAESGAEDSPSVAWVCHRTFYYQVMVSLERASGGTPASEIIDGFRRPVFYGWPVRFSNVFPKVAAVNSVVCTFGDHRMAANMGDRRAYSVSFSDQATVGSVNLWSSDQVGFKAHERFDISVHSIGDDTDAGPVVGLSTAAS